MYIIPEHIEQCVFATEVSIFRHIFFKVLSLFFIMISVWCFERTCVNTFSLLSFSGLTVSSIWSTSITNGPDPKMFTVLKDKRKTWREYIYILYLHLLFIYSCCWVKWLLLDMDNDFAKTKQETWRLEEQLALFCTIFSFHSFFFFKWPKKNLYIFHHI